MTLTKKVNGITIVLSAQEESDIKALWSANETAAQKEEALTGHLKRRRAKYPSQEEQLEAIYAAIAQLKTDGTVFPPVVETWLTNIDTVNSTYPKS